MKKIKTAVIGVGHHGRLHAQKYTALNDAELVSVVDISRERAHRIAAEFNTSPCFDYRDVLNQVDAVSIVVPAEYHYAIARDCLEQGVHVLLEKPMTTDVDDARRLVELARHRQRVLQVGHLERFNPTVTALKQQLSEPMFIEAQRIAPFNTRGIDVNVILDVMIHDLDLILDLVPAPISRVDASGIPVLTPHIDIASARLRFANGCTANLTASRVGFKSEYKMRLFQRDAYFSLDLRNKKLTVRRKAQQQDPHTDMGAEIVSDDYSFEQCDAIQQEISDFLTAITTGKHPKVSGSSGLRALEIAVQITDLVNAAQNRISNPPGDS